MFPKVPCDRSRFAGRRGYGVAPRASRRACVRRQRARVGGCAGVDMAGARFDTSSLSSDPTLLITTTRAAVAIMQ